MLAAAAISAMLEPVAVLRAVRDEHGAVVDATVVQANKPGLALLGRFTQPVVGRRVTQLLPADAVALLMADCRAAIESQAPVARRRMALAVPPASGALPTVVDRNIAHTGDDVLVVSLRDLTRQAALEAELRDTRALLEQAAGDAADGIAALQSELRQAREQLELGFEQAVVGMALLDRNGRYVHANRALCAFLGRSAEELSTMTTLDVTHPDDVVEMTTAYERLRSGAQPHHVAEKRYVRPDGSVVWGLRSLVQICDEDGTERGFFTQVLDLTDRKAAEHALRESEERFRELVLHSSDVLLILEPDGRIRYVSPAVERVLGRSADRLGRLSVYDLAHPDDVAGIGRALARTAARPGVHRPHEFRARHADGSWRTLEMAATNLLDDAEVRGIVANCRDVTDRRHAKAVVETQSLILGMVARGRPLPETLEALARAVEALSDSASCVIATVDRERRRLRVMAAPTLPATVVDAMTTQPLEDPPVGPTSEAVLSGRTIGTRDIERQRQWAPAVRRLLRSEGYRACLATPFRASSDGRVVGAVTLYLREGRTAGPSERKHLELAASLAAIALDRDEAAERLVQQALHDPLTGLPNRILFSDRLRNALARIRRTQRTLAVLFFDLDRFKLVNDSLGHNVGDRLLNTVGERMRSHLRPGDTLARFGGDEFAILCEDIGTAADALSVAGRIRAAIAAPVTIDGRELVITASVGVATAGSSVETTPEELLRDADAAMYRAKELGRSRTEMFDQAMRTRALLRLELEHALRRAVAEGAVEVHYQPEIELRTGRVVGVEALARWCGPDGVPVPPSDFIAIAEETGLIVPLGAAVLEQACRDAASWGDATDRPWVSVNLSPQQLVARDLVPTVMRVLEETGLEPSSLCLEVTESAVMEDPDASAAVMRRLKRLGVLLAVDDFGTGYSSLAYVKRLPLDFLKVDRSFIAGMGQSSDDTAIVTAVIRLATTLGLRVVAEGVETVEQSVALRRLGCEYGQGFLWSAALPAAGIPSHLPRAARAAQGGPPAA